MSRGQGNLCAFADTQKCGLKTMRQCLDRVLTPLLFVSNVSATIMRKRVCVYYTGRVQGVGFRYAVREVACGYEVAGFVQNILDGRVELLAEGEEEEVKAFLQGVRDGGLAGHIRQEQTNWMPATGEFNGFEIRF